MFSGSYHPDDVTFLLKPVRLEPTEIGAKERLIQSGRRHYSEMISREALPSPAYLRVFHEALEREKSRFGRDLLILARQLATLRPGNVTVVSLARAGTPVGVLVTRALRRLLACPAHHYSVSIIRDRGIDATALQYILEHHPDESVVFVDGWTGKGVIARELRQAVTAFNARHGSALDPGLYAVADLCGAATFAATTDDYLIPSSILGATVSGLVSRSILNDTVVGPGDFHGCLYYEEFAAADLSRGFVDDVFRAMERSAPGSNGSGATLEQQARRRAESEKLLAHLRRRGAVKNLDHIKPGLGEATRVLLRRVPDRLLVRDAGAADVAHLLLLAREKNVPIVVDADLPYAAVALIKELDG
jgi:hypothetical protein